MRLSRSLSPSSSGPPLKTFRKAVKSITVFAPRPGRPARALFGTVSTTLTHPLVTLVTRAARREGAEMADAAKQSVGRSVQFAAELARGVGDFKPDDLAHDALT